MTVRLNRVELGSDLALTDVTGPVSRRARGLEGEFEARVNGEAEIAGLMSRGPLRANVQILSSDGGAVLRSAGIFRTAHGGRMQLNLESLEPRSYAGAAHRGPAPARRACDGGASEPDLGRRPSGTARRRRHQPRHGRRALPARPGAPDADRGRRGRPLARHLDGRVYDTNARRFDMQGVVSPLYMVNGLVGALFAPRREGLFGFSYRLTGSAQIRATCP
jgi:hypothetical protein